LGVLWFYFDRYIPARYSLSFLPSPYEVIRDPLICRWSFTILGLLLISYFFAQHLGVPVSLMSAIAALVMLALAGRWFHKQGTPALEIRKILREVPWQVILFSLGIYLLVISLHNAALTTLISQLLEQLSHWGLTLAATGTGFLAALLSSVINNLPTVLMNASAIQDSPGIEPAVREVMVYANIIGCSLGAKITPFGSLSTLLWFNILVRKELGISSFGYIGIAIIVTIPVLFISLLTLAIWLPWLMA
jgi:arsenical pump membrane protein